MGLINREELLKAFGLSEKTRKYGGDHSGYSTWMLYEIQDTIEEVEEVEAIPVDWLENFLKEESDKGLESDAILVAYGMIILCKWKEEQKGN